MWVTEKCGLQIKNVAQKKKRTPQNEIKVTFGKTNLSADRIIEMKLNPSNIACMRTETPVNSILKPCVWQQRDQI